MGSSISLFQFLYSFHLDRIAIAIHLSLTISVQLPNALVVSTYQPVLADVTMPSDEPEKGDKVSWNWGGGAPGGTVTEKKTEGEVSITSKKGNKVKKNAGFPVPACSAISRFDASKHSISHLSTSRQRLPDLHSRTLYSLALSHIRAHYHSLDLVFLTLLST